MVKLASPAEPFGLRSREDRWADARRRAEEAPAALRPALHELLASVETAAPALARLQGLVEQSHPAGAPGADVDHLLTFIEADVLDVFHHLRLRVAALVPGPGAWMEDADPQEADGYASLLDRLMRVLVLASADPTLAPDLRDAIVSAGRELSGWYGEFRQRLDRVDAGLFGPAGVAGGARRTRGRLRRLAG